MGKVAPQKSTLFSSRLKSVVLAWHSGNHGSVDTKVFFVFSMLFSVVIAAWTFGIHALQAQPLSPAYSLSIGISISTSYTIALFVLSRMRAIKRRLWQSILVEFIVFQFFSSLLLAITFTISRIIIPYGSPSPLWPGLFIRQAPISVAVFFVYWALALAIGAKRAAKPRSAKPCLGDATLLEAHGNYVRVTTPVGSRMIRMTLAMAEQSLPMEHFCRIHRSRIVRRDQIESVDWLDATVRLPTGETVKASSSGLAHLRTILS